MNYVKEDNSSEAICVFISEYQTEELLICDTFVVGWPAVLQIN